METETATKTTTAAKRLKEIETALGPERVKLVKAFVFSSHTAWNTWDCAAQAFDDVCQDPWDTLDDYSPWEPFEHHGPDEFAEILEDAYFALMDLITNLNLGKDHD